MKNLWNNKQAVKLKNDPLALRVYTSRLLGQESDLVLHGGGNTSVKTTVKNLFQESEDILYIKGSGWDLATIEKSGFAPVKMDVLKKMAQLKDLSDSEMVKGQRAAMLDPNAPNPSVEAILHAIIPFKFVDHTHADSVVCISNTPDGEKRIREVYGQRVLIIPYVMPGFILAREIYRLTRHVNWGKYEGMVLLNHGIFSFHDDAKESYGRMIRLVSAAENYLKVRGTPRAFILTSNARKDPSLTLRINLLELARIRRNVSKVKGSPMLAILESNPPAHHFSSLKNVSSIATRGPLTPDHLIRTKPRPVIIKNPQKNIKSFAEQYKKYFDRNTDGKLTCLDLAPRWAVWPGQGLILFGSTLKDAKIVSDIVGHTIRVIQQAEKLGGWRPLPEKQIFEMEYWELEQAKLKNAAKPLIFQGKIALVTGAASGIGKACVESLQAQGAVVAALDINKDIKKIFQRKEILGIACDVTDDEQIEKAVGETIRHFGGLDILISNAGTFPPSEKIDELKNSTWDKSLKINLSSHQKLLRACLPYLSVGIDPAIVIVGSKNVPAPGPGAAAYSVAKAGLTQLARVAALELAPKGIRINVIHPNQVFDTAIWTKDVLEKRAKNYGVSVEEYKKSNLLQTEITSKDVAQLVCAMAGPIFSKTTGAQIPIDGGNERVI